MPNHRRNDSKIHSIALSGLLFVRRDKSADLSRHNVRVRQKRPAFYGPDLVRVV